MAILLAVSVAVGKVVEGQGAFWAGSFLFTTLALFLLGFRIAIRAKSGEWMTDSEWLYFPLYILLLVALWLWVRAWDAAFVIVGGLTIYLWLDYLRGQLELRDQNAHTLD